MLNILICPVELLFPEHTEVLKAFVCLRSCLHVGSVLCQLAGATYGKFCILWGEDASAAVSIATLKHLVVIVRCLNPKVLRTGGGSEKKGKARSLK